MLRGFRKYLHFAACGQRVGRFGRLVRDLRVDDAASRDQGRSVVQGRRRHHRRQIDQLVRWS